MDPNHDGNGFSFYYYSRLDIHGAGGSLLDCEDLRDGCPAMVPQAHDGYPGDYSYVSIDTTPDSVAGPGQSLTPDSALGACTRSQQLRFGVRPARGAAITRAKMYVDGRLVLTRTGRSLRAVTVPGLPGKARHRVRLYEYTRRGLARITTRDVYGCAR